MKSFTHLSLGEREIVSRGLVSGASFRTIGRTLGRDPSTVMRDLQKNGMTRTTYRALDADVLALCRAEIPKKPGKITRNSRLRRYIHRKLREEWSPEQIASVLPQAYPHDMAMRVSHETIYTYLYCLPRGELRKELLGYLRRTRKERRKRSGTYEKRGQMPEMTSISERPPEVALRTVLGHWEGDLIVGKNHQSAIGTLVERTTRTTILVPLKAKDAVSVRKAFERELATLPRQMKVPLTYDRGKEMSEHRLFAENTRMTVYFADPYSPWQRGTNENTNGLIRQYFPKGTDLSVHSRAAIKRVQRKLNGRPRKVLGWKTPYEVFTRLLNERSVALGS